MAPPVATAGHGDARLPGVDTRTDPAAVCELVPGELVTVVVVVDSVTGKVAAGPEILARGFSEDAAAFDEVRPLIEEALAGAAKEGVGEVHQLQQVVRRTLGKWVSDTYRRRPMIIPVVVEV